MAHIIVSEAEAILDKEFKVLDYGFVRLVDYMGGDTRIAQAARVSYGGGTKSVSEDAVLIDYLLSHAHSSPFEQVVMVFHCKLPIFVARQWVRHRTARLNEISGRYSILKDEFYLPDDKRIQLQSKSNRQGSSEIAPATVRVSVLDLMEHGQDKAACDYHEILNYDVTRELARIGLPLSTYTEWYWQMDLHNLFRFLMLRMDSHAQWEIQQYANQIAEIVKLVVPAAYDAFEKYILKSKKFSEEEIGAICSMLEQDGNPLQGQKRIDFEKKLGIYRD